MIVTGAVVKNMRNTLKNKRMTLLSEKCVGIYSDMKSVVREGDLITLAADMVGYEDTEITLQWQFSNGLAWIDVPGANGLTHSFVATDESIHYSWRVSVHDAD